MTVKERVRRLLDDLPDSELYAAERYLEYLRDSRNPIARALDNAPLDDEPDDDDFDGGLTEARTEPSLSHVEARQRLLGE